MVLIANVFTIITTKLYRRASLKEIQYLTHFRGIAELLLNGCAFSPIKNSGFHLNP